MLAGSLTELLDTDLGKALINLPEEELFGMVLNDFYKPKMHKLYSALYTGVEADFQLRIRKTPFTLERIRNEASSSHCVMVAWRPSSEQSTFVVRECFLLCCGSVELLRHLADNC